MSVGLVSQGPHSQSVSTAALGTLLTLHQCLDLLNTCSFKQHPNQPSEGKKEKPHIVISKIMFFRNIYFLLLQYMVLKLFCNRLHIIYNIIKDDVELWNNLEINLKSMNNSSYHRFLHTTLKIACKMIGHSYTICFQGSYKFHFNSCFKEFTLSIYFTTYYS